MRPEKGNIVFELKLLDNLLKKNADAHFRILDEAEQLTRMHHWIIDYLYRNGGRDIYQRDIESEFRISRSTTSNMLSLMEKKELIQRLNVESDARLKKVVLTEKAIRLHNMHMDACEKLDYFIESSITPEEKAEFLRIINKLRDAVKASMEAEHIRIEDDRR